MSDSVSDFNCVRNTHLRLLLRNDRYDEAREYIRGLFDGIADVHDEHTAASKVFDAVGAINTELFPKRMLTLLVDSYLTQ